MQKKYLNRWLYTGALAVVGALMMTLASCDDDDSGPDAIANSPDFAATVSSSYKISAPTGIQVSFQNKSQNVKDYSWDFGDGSAAVTDAAPTHVYALPGTYTVTLTTTAADGATPATQTKSAEVVVTDPTASLTNLIEGGSMEAADENKWTKVYTGQKANGELAHVAGEFGSSKNKPAAGVGGGLNVSVPEGFPAGGEAGTLWYQEVELAAGIYKFDAAIKHGTENPTGGERAFKDYWFELYLGKEVPAEGDGYNHDATAGLTGFIFSSWLGNSIPANNKPWAATDGILPQATWFVPSPANDQPLMSRKAATIADSNGVMELEAGTYHFVIKAGFGGQGGFGANGITIDNVRLVKLQ
jgi:PKD repeat protein